MIIAGLVIGLLGVFWCFLVFVLYSTHPAPSQTNADSQFMFGLIVGLIGLVLSVIGGVRWAFFS
jgi:hypothetical protein